MILFSSAILFVPSACYSLTCFLSSPPPTTLTLLMLLLRGGLRSLHSSEDWGWARHARADLANRQGRHVPKALDIWRFWRALHIWGLFVHTPKPPGRRVLPLVTPRALAYAT